MKKRIFFLFILFFLPSFCFGDSYLEKNIFFVEKNYDLFRREKVLATNLFTSENCYFYVDDDFFGKMSQSEKQSFYEKIKNLAFEFERKIYPNLTRILGKEMEKGINGDKKITVLIHEMKEEVGGYFREADFFEKLLSPKSNQRKILYLNSLTFDQGTANSAITHEFSHLIIFNQKNLILKVEEERWLQEIVAEIAPTLLGYFENLNSRIEIFKKYPNDPILEWQDSLKDYGALSIFAHYLLDQFGVEFFGKILKVKETGIGAIEKITNKKFEQIFGNWLVATFLNDCSLGREFCYKIEELKNLKILPEIHFLPITGGSTLTLFRKIKDFTPSWQKFYGGKGNLSLVFVGEAKGEFEVNYALCDKEKKCKVFKLEINPQKEGKVLIENFDSFYESLVLFVFSKTEKKEPEKEAKTFDFVFKINSQEEKIPTETQKPEKPIFSCQSFKKFLSYGSFGEEVKCLQEVLKFQGPEIYPEGLVTGYFGPLTLAAVKRFQEKYWKEILAPWGLAKNQATGFVGQMTIAKLNEILKSL